MEERLPYIRREYQSPIFEMTVERGRSDFGRMGSPSWESNDFIDLNQPKVPKFSYKRQLNNQ